MSKKNHPNRSGIPPMGPAAYCQLAADLRHFASVLESNSPCLTIYQERALSQTIKNLSATIKKASLRHAARPRKNQESVA